MPTSRGTLLVLALLSIILLPGCLGPIYGIYEVTKTKEDDTNRAPVVSITGPDRWFNSSAVPVVYTVSDADGDGTSIIVSYNDNFAGWTPCTTLTAPVLTTPPNEYTIFWDAATDLGTAATKLNMQIGVTAYDGSDFSLRSETAPFILGNNTPTIVITPPPDGQGNVVVDYTLEDPASDDCTVLVQYGLSGTGPWTNCTPASAIAVNPAIGVASLPGPLGHSFTWDTQADLPNLQQNIWIQVTATDAAPAAGTDVTGVSFEVNNNGLPYGTFLTTSMVLYDTHGIVTIPYRIQDPEGDACSISMQYSREDETGWHTCTEFPARMSDGISGLASFILAGDEKDGEHLFLWNSTQDIGRVDILCELRLQVTDAAGNTSGWVLKGIPMANAFPAIGTPSAIATGTDPEYVMIHDLDHDGYADLVVSDYTDDALTYSYGSATGHTMPVSTISTLPVTSPQCLAAADLDGDGYDEIIVGSMSITTDIAISYTNAGGPTAPVALVAPNGIRTITIGDINADGYEDIAFTGYYDDLVSVSYGSGAGHTTPVDSMPATNPYWVAMGDIDGDGFDDIVFTTEADNNVGISYGSGAGADLTPDLILVVNRPTFIACGDINGDGYDDVVCTKDASNEAGVMYGSGAGLGPAVNVVDMGETVPLAGPMGLVFSDINADGYADFAITYDKSDMLRYCLGSPTGYQPPTAVNPGGIDPEEVKAADINGDGYMDLITAHWSSSSFGLAMGSAVGLVERVPAVSAGSGSRRLATGDLNGDGFDDMACLNGQDDTLTILYGRGAIAQMPVEGISREGDAYTGVAGDFNMDGYTDLATSVFLSSNIYHSYGEAVGHRDFYSSFDSTILPFLLSYRTGHFNDDGYLDLISGSTAAAGAPDDIPVSYGGPAGLSETPDLITVGDNPREVAVGDINADGYDDVAAANTGSDDVSIIYGSITGLGTATDVAAGTEPQIPIIADINGDGYGDILVPCRVTNNLAINMGTITGHSPAFTFLTTDAGPTEVLSADVNMDGFPDLICLCPGIDSLTVHYGSSLGHQDPADSFGIGANAISLRSGDLNGDGFPDLACVNQNDNNVSIFYGARTGLQAPVTAATGTMPTSLVIYDMNGDGYSDIAVCNFSGNEYTLIIGGPQGHREPIPLMIGAVAIGLFTADINHDGAPDLLGGSPPAKAFVGVMGETVQYGKTQLIDTGTFTDTFLFNAVKIDFPIGAFAAPREVTVWLGAENIQVPHSAPGTPEYPVMPVSFPWDLMRKDISLAAGAAALTLPVKPQLPDDILDWGSFRLYRSHWGPDRLDPRDDAVELVASTAAATLTVDPLNRTLTTAGAGDIDRFGRYQLFLVTDDTDGDSLPDAWEMKYFLGLATVNGGPAEHFDADGVDNITEYQNGTAPNDDNDF